MKTKKIQKPFSIEAWKNGAKIETRDGRKVRILCTDLIGKQPIVAAVMCKDGEEGTMHTCIDGRYYTRCEDSLDIVIVEEVEEPKWADDEDAQGEGWFIDTMSNVTKHTVCSLNYPCNRRAYSTKKQVKSALAMARIGQLMAHDERYGGVVTDEEWKDETLTKYTICRKGTDFLRDVTCVWYEFLAFHTSRQRDLFLAENLQLVKEYLMIE